MIFILFCYQFSAIIGSMVFSYVLYRMTKLWSLAWIVLIALISCVIIPDKIAEEHWRRICSSDGGVQIYKKVVAPGFYIEGTTDSFMQEMLGKGYSRVETKRIIDGKNSIVSYFISGNGVSKSTTSGIASDYRVVDRNSTHKGYYTAETVIENSAGVQLATDRTLYFYGGRVFKSLRILAGGSDLDKNQWLYMCPSYPDPTQLILQTIQPDPSQKD
ncbi:hypothetical protein [Pseudomonas sp. UMAB-08]|uniref:hypothetical protein n=1 Tax=Pseudomonas sp. UMAB-08 TaxID=1365375 RepID=UPI001C5A291C|nr:hypothetical protein [Pseudomonas sp. UMAB-08]